MGLFDRFQDEKHNEWARKIKERDRHHCQICRNVHHLHAHHILNYAEYPEFRYSLENGICCCSTCHLNFHAMYGKSGNNKAQLREFIILTKVIEKVRTQSKKDTK